MDNIFNNILTYTSDDISVSVALITMFSALILGTIITLTYYFTQSPSSYQRSFAVTLFMLPIILSVIIIFIGSNIARAFSLAGTLSIIRFRSAPGDAKDIGFIFFDIAAGLACGTGLYGYAALFTIILCAALFIIEKGRFFSPKHIRKTLKITVPEDLSYHEAFDDILTEYSSEYKLTEIRTTELGSLFLLVYNILLTKDVDEQSLINRLRCRNGNLTIMLLDSPENTKK